MKNCSKCGEPKPTTAFYKGMGRCKACHKAKSRLWALAHPEKVAENRHRWRAKPGSKAKEVVAAQRWYRENLERAKDTRFVYELKKYGLTLDQYHSLYEKQDFLCALGEDHDMKLDIDHDHSTGKVRGLLCSNCNRGIGLLQDNPTVLTKAAQYISASA